MPSPRKDIVVHETTSGDKTVQLPFIKFVTGYMYPSYVIYSKRSQKSLASDKENKIVSRLQMLFTGPRGGAERTFYVSEADAREIIEALQRYVHTCNTGVPL
jgi:hypothetical protein